MQVGTEECPACNPPVVLTARGGGFQFPLLIFYGLQVSQSPGLPISRSPGLPVSQSPGLLSSLRIVAKTDHWVTYSERPTPGSPSISSHELLWSSGFLLVFCPRWSFLVSPNVHLNRYSLYLLNWRAFSLPYQVTMLLFFIYKIKGRK